MYSINRQLRIIGLFAFLMIVGVSLLAGCHSQNQTSTGHDTRQPESTSGFLTITGNGVGHQTKFSLTELKKMDEALVGECYSVVNNWPSKKFFVGKGVLLSHLLESAGIKRDAQTIIVWAADGYFATFTREQLDERRFYFPNLLEGSEEGAQEVSAILAWEHWEGSKDLSKAKSGKLRLLLGQKGLNDVVAPVCIKDVAVIEVLSSPPGQWDPVQAEPDPGKVKQGTEVVLKHPHQDQVKIYYTVDGSTPDEKSLVYNPSTTYFQPDLNKPITVDKSMIIKAKVIGFGKQDSQVATFAYDVE